MSLGAAATVRISPGAPPRHWEVRVPGSKSLTNRALLLAAVAGPGHSRIVNPLLADDTAVMVDALRALGASVDNDDGGDLVIGGMNGPPRGVAEIWCGMAGTVARFLLPMLAAGHGRFAVDADPQLRRRPLGPLIDALLAQGAVVGGTGLPLTLFAEGLSGGEVPVDASASSQFLSGLLMAAPLARAGSRLVYDALVSRPYLELTLEAMRAFGVHPSVERAAIRVPAARYRPTELEIEPDASTASYFLASAALTATTVRLPGLDLETTTQGDIEIVRHLQAMGATIGYGSPLRLTGAQRLRGIEVNMGDSSDVFMTLACVAPFAEGPTTIEGIAHARVKESDRIAATAENLRRLGIEVLEGADFIRITPGTPRPARLPTYDDHRIAMAFSLIGTRVPVVLDDPGVVSKTCPQFFQLWRETGATVQLGGEATFAEPIVEVEASIESFSGALGTGEGA
ncbi:MAG: 3-phosphoshikimate 1-carboxyvinyltransferase [Solirubrobacteraceae bacterium]